MVVSLSIYSFLLHIVISSKKKDRSSTHQPVVKPRAKEKKRLPDADDDSDNDTGMYTEPQSKVGQETKLLRKRIQPHSQSPGKVWVTIKG